MSAFLQNYAISFWNGAWALVLLSYWDESRVQMNFMNYIMLVIADVGRMMIGNPLYQSITAGFWGSSTNY